MRSRQAASRASAAGPARPSSDSSRARSSSSVERVLGQLGERDVRVDELERRAAELVLELLQPGEVGTEHHHAEVGLVPEHREQQRLVAVVDERLHRVDDPLARLRIGIGAGTVDLVEEVEDAPPDAGLDRCHALQATDGDRPPQPRGVTRG